VIDRGLDPSLRTSSRARPTVSPNIRTPASSTGLCRLQVSTTVRTRNGRPAARVSCAKSMFQRSLRPEGTGTGRPHALGNARAYAAATPLAERQSSDSFAIDQPSLLTPQEHPSAQISKPWSRVSEIANPYPECELILGPTPSIPGRSTELGQPTGPRTPYLKRRLKPVGELPAAGGP
jgi:hypothetical protein